MSLVKCKECGKDVSTEAERCPNCGNPIKQQSPSQTPAAKKGMGCGTWILILFGIFFGIGLIGTLLEDSNKNTQTKKEQPIEEQAGVESQEETITTSFPSPILSSTPVDNWQVNKGISEIDDSPTVILSLSGVA